MNAVFHPPGMIMNAGWIEHTNGGFLFYKEGMTDVARPRHRGGRCRAHRDRQGARRSLRHLPRLLLQCRADDERGARQRRLARACRESAPNATLKSPSSLDHRYVHEDVGYGLVPMAALGRLAGVATPTIDALVHLASLSRRHRLRARRPHAREARARRQDALRSRPLRHEGA